MSRKSRPRESHRPPGPARAAATPMDRGRLVWIAAAIAVLTVAVYAQVHGFPFITNYDDSLYVTDNPHVTSGLNLANVAWAFTHPCAGNWHPLTMLTHMTDVSWFGVTPGPPHVVNLLLHVLDALLLLLVLYAATRRVWESAFVAALFALHPLHVESVAWIAERKDVLSTLFWMLTLWGYVRYARSGRRADYLLALGAFALGLMSKPMLVTLPAVLVLLDVWPLKRIAGADGKPAARGRLTWSESLVEKWPFAALAAVSIVLTLWAQKQSGATLGTVILPLGTRLANAVVAYVRYVAKLFVPTRLAFLYPYATHLPAAQVAGAALLLVALTVAAVAARRAAPYVTIGWLWFVGTLVPVIGIVQAGSQSMADRYTYVPHIGLYIALAWGAGALASRFRVPRAALATAAALALAGCAVLTFRQAGYWSSAERLFRHGLDVTQGNYIAENNYAVELMNRGDIAGAQAHFQQAVDDNPTYGNALCNLGITDTKLQRFDAAHDALVRARGADPANPKVLLNLGFVSLLQKRYADAVEPLRKALSLDPANVECHELLANALNGAGAELAQQGHAVEALQAFEEAVSLDPSNTNAKRNLEIARAAGVATPSKSSFAR